MRGTLWILFLLLAGPLVGFCQHTAILKTPSHSKAADHQWTLVWQDEFSKNGKPDPNKWNFAGRGTPAWQCYCYDDTTTAIVHNDNLYLKGIVSKKGTDTAQYQTGCIDTRGKFSFLYGKLEIRAKFSHGRGSWPAIWLMPEESIYGDWPKSGEIDVMEHLNSDSIIYQTMHSYYIEALKHLKDPDYVHTTAFKVGQFNIYGMEWYPDRIDFFVNGKKTFSYPKMTKDTTGSQWPFNQPFYIILDQALGGEQLWLGAVDENALPARLVLDWIRVYQQEEDKE